VTNEIAIKVHEPVIQPGWQGKPKGMWQILWERGFIDEDNAKKYVKNKSQEWLDDDGNLRDEYLAQYKKYSLNYLISQLTDFKNEKSAMEFLAEQLSKNHRVKFDIFTSTKYHCEMAGEGIEYCWGFCKKTYRRIPLWQKSKKDLFLECVNKSLGSVSMEVMRKFSAKARRYMLTYQVFDNAGKYDDFNCKGLSYSEIEKHVTQIMKTHRCSADQAHSYISKVWRDSQQHRASHI
jgi:hypothetical protein